MDKILPKSDFGFADQMLDAVFLVDVDGRIKYVSAACRMIFGYMPEEMVGRFIFDFLAPGDRGRTLEEAGKVMAGQQRVGFENRYLRKNGEVVHIMWSARWLESERLRIGVARDITKVNHSRQSNLDGSRLSPSLAPSGAARVGRGKVRKEDSGNLLTGRQKEVLEFLNRGLTYREVAELLGLRESTVVSHVRAIYDRLGVSNKVEALFEGRVLGLIG